MRSCPRRARTTRHGSPRHGSGSSIPWTERGSSGRRAARIGRCTSRSGSGPAAAMAGWQQALWPCRRMARRSARCRVTSARTGPPEFVRKRAAETGAELVLLGSAGAKIVLVLTGGVDAYIHAGGQHEWDSAAPVAVVQAAGLHASRIDGRPLAYNQPDPRLPDILVCRPGIAGQLLAEIRAIRVREG